MKRIFTLLTALLCLAVSAAAALPTHVTWTTEVEPTGPASGVIKWTATIEKGWHIYAMDMPVIDNTTVPDGTSFTIDPVDGLTLEGSPKPSREAVNHYDDVLKLNLPWWEDEVSFTQAYTLADGVKGVNIEGMIRYMACSNTACTPPTKEAFSLSFGEAVAAAPTAVADQAGQPESKAESSVSAADNAQWWQPVDAESDTTDEQSPWWAIFGLGLLGGLLALLTPCVWPMIPMTVSFFLKKGKDRRRSIADAVIYGLSIVVIYLVLGLAITLIFGASKLNDIATSAVFNLIFFALLVVFAISFFGAFDIQLPERWRNSVDRKAETTSGMLSIFFMAFTLVLVSFSCTGPIIGTLLVEAASQGSIVGPAVGMGGFALGLALPFALFAFFPSLLKEVPRSGGWLNSVKVVLGFVELILSLKFLSVADLAYGWRILDREVFLSIWIVLFVLLGLYLLGKLRFSHDTPRQHTSVLSFFLAVASLSFAVYLVPGLWGAPLKVTSAFAPPLNTQDFNLYGGTFKEFDNYDEGMAYAAENNKPVLLDFSGFACVNCRKMEGAVFDTPEVRSIIDNNFVLIKLMVDDKTPLEHPYTVEEYGRRTPIETVGDRWSYLQRHKFGINSQPYYVMLDNQGDPLAGSRVYDENVAAFIEWLNQGLEAYK